MESEGFVEGSQSTFPELRSKFFKSLWQVAHIQQLSVVSIIMRASDL